MNENQSIYLAHQDKKYEEFLEIIHKDKYLMDMALSYNRDYGVDEALKVMDYETISSFLLKEQELLEKKYKGDDKKLKQLDERYRYLDSVVSDLKTDFLGYVKRRLGCPYPSDIIENVHDWYEKEIKAGEEDYFCSYYGYNEVLEDIDICLGCGKIKNDYTARGGNYSKAEDLYYKLLNKRRKESTQEGNEKCVLKSQTSLPEPDQKTKEAFKTYEDIVNKIVSYGQKVRGVQPTNE